MQVLRTTAEIELPARGAVAARWFYGWRIVAVSVLGQAFATGFTTYAFGVFQKPMAAEFGASLQQVALGMTLWTVTVAVFSTPLGYCLDRYSIRAIMGLGAGLMALGFAAMALTHSLWLEGLLFGGVVGVGMLALAGACPKMVATWFVQRRGRALGITALGTSLGGLLVPPLAATAIEALGWRGALVSFAVLLVVVVIPVAWLVVVNRPEDLGLTPDGSDLQPTVTALAAPNAAAEWHWTRALRERNFWLITFSVGLCIAAQGVVIINLHPYATDLGISSRAAALLLSCLSASSMAGKLVFGAVADRFDTRFAMWIAIGALCFYLSTLLSHPSYRFLVAASLCGGMGLGGFLPLWGALVGRCYGRQVFGRVHGLMAALMGPLNWVAFPFAGRVHDRVGSYDPAFAVFLGAAAIAAVLLIFLRPPQREPGT